MAVRAVKVAFGAVLLVLLSQAVPAAEIADWPRWRGPGDNGCAAANLAMPEKFSATENVVWKTALPGQGCSTPIVLKDRIYLTAPIDGNDAAEAYDLSGKLVWQTAFGPQRKGQHRNGSGCNPSAATDGRGVFVYFKSGTLAALDLDGKVCWKANLQERFGKDTLYWDIGTSPALTRKDVVIAVMHHGESYLAAFDKQTGDLHWKAARNYVTPEEGDHSYATPLVLEQGGKESLLVWGGQHLTAHDAADGAILWSVGDFNPDDKKNWVAVATPVIAAGVAVVPYGRGDRLHGIKLGGSGDVTATHRLWVREDIGAFCPTPAAHEGKVIVLRDGGKLEAIDPASGKTLWKTDLPQRSAKFYASPLVAGGKIYCAREDGKIFVVRAEEPHDLLAENDMGERIVASPVPLGDRLLIRGEEHLFCIGKP